MDTGACTVRELLPVTEDDSEEPDRSEEAEPEAPEAPEDPEGDPEGEPEVETEALRRSVLDAYRLCSCESALFPAFTTPEASAERCRELLISLK